MKYQKPLVALALIASSIVCNTAHASLFDRGGGMIYDDVNNITWAADANLFKTQAASNANLVNDIITANGGVVYDTPNHLDNGTYNLTIFDFNTSYGNMTWWGAQAWVNSLSLGGFTDWRLPTTIPANYGFNQTGSEMGHLFYTDLGVAAGQSITSSISSNYDLFSNVQPFGAAYWSGSEYADIPAYAWVFYTHGFQYNYGKKNYTEYAWAVRTGDVATVPVPGAVWLFGSGLLGLLSLKRRGNIG